MSPYTGNVTADPNVSCRGSAPSHRLSCSGVVVGKRERNRRKAGASTTQPPPAQRHAPNTVLGNNDASQLIAPRSAATALHDT